MMRRQGDRPANRSGRFGPAGGGGNARGMTPFEVLRGEPPQPPAIGGNTGNERPPGLPGSEPGPRGRRPHDDEDGAQ